MSGDGGSFGSANLHVGSDWAVQCYTYPGTTPILSVDAGRMAVSVSIADRQQMSTEAVAFAAEFARQAARFAADCERLHAAQHGQACETGQQAADDAA